MEMSFDLPDHVVVQLGQLPQAERNLYAERLFVMALYELEQRRETTDELAARRRSWQPFTPEIVLPVPLTSIDLRR